MRLVSQKAKKVFFRVAFVGEGGGGSTQADSSGTCIEINTHKRRIDKYLEEKNTHKHRHQGENTINRDALK